MSNAIAAALTGVGNVIGGMAPTRRQVKAGSGRNRLSILSIANLLNLRRATASPADFGRSPGPSEPDPPAGSLSSFRALRYALLAIAVFVAALWAMPTEAQTAVTLVKNTGQTKATQSSSFAAHNPRHAQQFLTGTHSPGYDITSVGIAFGTIGDTSTAGSQLTVSINEVSSGNPGDAHCTLTNPGTFTEDTTLYFTASSCTLAAGTEYFVLVQRTTVTNDIIHWDRTESDDEDDGHAAGWSIANNRASYINNRWTTSSTDRLKTELQGTLKTAPVGVNIIPHTASVIDEESFGQYYIVLNKQPTASVTIDITTSTGISTNVDDVTFTTTNWYIGQAVTVSAPGDDDVLSNAARITHSVDSGSAAEYTSLTNLASIQVSIMDDDSESRHTGVLVKNTGPVVTSGGTDYILTQGVAVTLGFTTGTNDDGYQLRSIGLRFAAISDPLSAGNDLQATLNQETYNSAESQYEPGTALCTLTDPSIFTANAVNSFAAPNANPCPTLTKETNYFVVVKRVATTGGSTIGLKTTLDEVEDQWAAGWSLDDDLLFFAGVQWYTDVTDQALQMAVNGAVLPVNVALSETPFGIYEGTSRAYSLALTHPPTANVTIDITASGDLTTNPTNLTFTTTTWDTPQPVTVSAAPDDDETDDSATITHAVRSGSAPEYIAATELETLPVDVRDSAGVLVANSLRSTTSARGGLGTSTTRIAQGFTTGPNPAGYDLDSIGIRFHPDTTETDASKLIATIRSANRSPNPDAVLCTLTNPSALTSGLNVFTVPDGCHPLDPSTLHFFHLERTDTSGGVIGLSWTDSDREDMAAQGWNIYNLGHRRTTGWQAGALAHLIEVKGSAAPNTATGAPSIQGILEQVRTLKADTVGIDDADGMTGAIFSYQWVRVDGMTETNVGANSPSYRLVADDVGKTIKLTVSFTDDAQNDESVTSAETPTVVASGATHSLVWLATITVDRDSALQNYGFLIEGSDTLGTLAPDSFLLRSVKREIAELYYFLASTDQTLTVSFNSALSADEIAHWTMHAVGYTFDLSDATASDSNQTFTWTLTATESSAFGAWGIKDTDHVVSLQSAITPRVLISEPELEIQEGGSDTYTISLGAEPTASVTVDITVSGDLSTNDPSVTFTTMNWADPQTITVTAAHDDDKVNDSVTITHSMAGGSAAEYASLTNLADVDVTIFDDDAPVTNICDRTRWLREELVRQTSSDNTCENAKLGSIT